MRSKKLSLYGGIFDVTNYKVIYESWGKEK